VIAKESRLMFKTLAVFCAFHLHAGVAQENTEVMGWYPNSGIALGKGVSKSYPLKEFQSCVSYNPKTIRPLDSNNSVKTKVKISLVTNTKTMHSTLGISGKVGANLAFISKVPVGDLNAQFGMENTRDINDSSLALVISAEADYGRYEIEPFDTTEGLTLKPKFQQMLAAGETNQFMQQCGTHFVIRERRRGAIHAVIKISELTKSKKRQLQASLQLGQTPANNPVTPAPTGDAETGANRMFTNPTEVAQAVTPSKLPANISLGVDNFLREAKESGGSVIVEFTTDGGGGLENQTDLFSEGKITFESLMKTVSQYLASFAQTNLPSPDQNYNYVNLPGAPFQYHLAPYSLIGVPLNTREINFGQLEELYYLTIGANSNLEILREVIEDLTPTESPESFQYVSKKISTYVNFMSDISKLADVIVSTGRTLQTSEIPVFPTMDLATVMPQVSILQSDFICETSGTDSACGKSTSNWSGKKWAAYIKVAGKISNAFRIKAVNVYKSAEHGQRGNPIFSITRNSSTGFMHFNPAGDFGISFNKMQQGKDEATYVAMRNALPLYEVSIVDTNGKMVDLVDLSLALKGPHAQL
jgi:hypothetical protein